MLSEGRDYLREAWWISTFPGLGILFTVLAMNLVGDGLRRPGSATQDLTAFPPDRFW